MQYKTRWHQIQAEVRAYSRKKQSLRSAIDGVIVASISAERAHTLSILRSNPKMTAVELEDALCSKSIWDVLRQEPPQTA